MKTQLKPYDAELLRSHLIQRTKTIPLGFPRLFFTVNWLEIYGWYGRPPAGAKTFYGAYIVMNSPDKAVLIREPLETMDSTIAKHRNEMLMQTLLPYYYLDVVRDDAVFTVEGLQVGGRRTIPLETIITELDEIAVQFLLQSPLIRSESPSRFFCYYDAQILLGIEDEWTNICLDRYAFASLNGIIKKGDAR